MSRKALVNGRKSSVVTKPSPSTQAQNTAKLKAFQSALRRARFNKSISERANEKFATQDPSVKAAYEENKMRLTNAWKSEFQQDLTRAATYLPSTKPVTREDKRALADFLKPLNELLKGRPLGMTPRLPAMAERAAAHLVRERLKFLRENTGKKRISKKSGVPAKLIADAIKEVSVQLRIPTAMISSANVSTLVYKK